MPKTSSFGSPSSVQYLLNDLLLFEYLNSPLLVPTQISLDDVEEYAEMVNDIKVSVGLGYLSYTNIIDFEGIRVLDLFAGTGSISYEFVSRGARSVTGIEMNTKQIDFIKKTCTKLKIDNLHVYRSDVFKYIAKCSERYDVVFADPPYQMNNIDELLAAVIGNRLLTDDGIFILEHNRHHSFADHPNLIDSRKYGNVHFSLFRA